MQNERKEKNKNNARKHRQLLRRSGKSEKMRVFICCASVEVETYQVLNYRFSSITTHPSPSRGTHTHLSAHSTHTRSRCADTTFSFFFSFIVIIKPNNRFNEKKVLRNAHYYIKRTLHAFCWRTARRNIHHFAAFAVPDALCARTFFVFARFLLSMHIRSSTYVQWQNICSLQLNGAGDRTLRPRVLS